MENKLIKELKDSQNNKLIQVDGEWITYKELVGLNIKEQRSIKNQLMNRFKKNPMDLNIHELNFLRKQEYLEMRESGRKTSKWDGDNVNIIYQEGFSMIPKDIAYIRRKIPVDVVGVLVELGDSVNKNGCLIYDNWKPIQTMGDLKKYLNSTVNIGDSIWKKFSKLNNEYIFVKKEKVDGVWYLVLNPVFSSQSYNISYFKFLTFGKLLLECKYISEIEYTFLCKKFEIIPEK